MAATVAALFGAVTFGVSLDRLIDEPERYGVVFDVGIGAGATELSDDILERV